MTAMMMALKYSMRPKPKGCFLSAGRCESFVPTMVMTLDSASLRLLTASITMATLLARMPTAALKPANNTLAIIPIQLVRMIWCARPLGASLVDELRSIRMIVLRVIACFIVYEISRLGISLFVVVGLALDDGAGAVDLFGEDEPYHLVGEGQA